MKAIFSLIALLLVVGITALLAKKQLSTATAPLAPTAASTAIGTPAATPASQVQQVGQQVQALMQQARPSEPEQ